jgi:hypothetical protein
MKSIYIKLFLLSFLIILGIAYFGLEMASAQGGNQPFKFEVPLPPMLGYQPEVSPAAYFRYIFVFLLAVGGVLAFAMIVVGGIQYALSGANPGWQKEAVSRIQQAILGLLLLLFSYIILQTINPELLRFRNPELPEPPSAPSGQHFECQNGSCVAVPGPGPNTCTSNMDCISYTHGCLEQRPNEPARCIRFYYNIGDCTSGSVTTRCEGASRSCVPISQCPNQPPPPPPPGGTQSLNGAGIRCIGRASCPNFPSGDCNTPLANSLISALLTLKARFPNLVTVTSSVCGTHVGGSFHYKGQAVDLVLPFDDNTTRGMLETLGASPCVDELIAPHRFGMLCRDRGVAVNCNTFSGHENHIHFAVKDGC